MRVVKYFLVGGTAATIDFSIFFFAVNALGYSWFPSAIVSFIVATGANYILSIRYVFPSKVRFGRSHEVILIFLASSITMAINQALLWIAIDIITINIYISKVSATGAVFLINFAIRNNYIFKSR